MAFEKRVCVLKQIKKGFSADGSALSGAVYCERLGEELTVTPRLLGLAPLKEGRYVLAVRVGKQDFFLELKGNDALRATCESSLSAGFSALLCFVKGEAEPVAFGFCGSAMQDFRPLLEALSSDGRKRPIPQPLPPVQTPAPAIPNEPLAPVVPLPGEEEPPFREQAVSYDDEAIALDDYFAHSHAHASGGDGGEEKAQKAEGGGDPSAHETAPYPVGTLTYYKEVRERLEEAFARFPADTRLKGSFPQSDWVRAGEGLLGIIYQSGVPKYLCVAVEKHGDPPEEMKENCCLVPASPFTEDEGFWVVFQDADTGAYVRVYDN